MGTRAMIHIRDLRSPDKNIVSIYHHFDGYPEGLGVKLSSLLDGMQIVNGLSYSMDGPVANGMNCLAAQVIARLKEEPGNVYINESSELIEYTYTVIGAADEPLQLMIHGFDGELLYQGSPEGLSIQVAQEIQEKECL